MNYRTASKQQLLAERARLLTASRKLEQRSGTQPSPGTGNVGGRGRSSARVPQQEVHNLTEQLAAVEVELKRREEAEVPAADDAQSA